jgi:cytochrome c oxidase subunit III
MSQDYQPYYVPASSHWPLLGASGLFLFGAGAATWFNGKAIGPYIFFTGCLIICSMMYGWFSNVIKENKNNLYSAQMDRSFRWGMAWFIFSEVMFFAVFFGALFYARQFSVPWLGGEGAKAATHAFLWPNFAAEWPLLQNPNPTAFIAPKMYMKSWPWPTINTILLLSSSITVTIAHHALIDAKRTRLNKFLALTVILGLAFVSLQAYEYYEAYHVLGLKLNSGIYGTTFFMLTGFHGAHVIIGSIMLFIMLLRCLRGDFEAKKHFGFEAAAWYWHFVDVVWLFLFIFVYILPVK